MALNELVEALKRVRIKAAHDHVTIPPCHSDLKKLFQDNGYQVEEVAQILLC